MKPPQFGYSRPESLGEALTVLAEQGDEGKVLSGGQSLVPLLSMRLAAPGHLVDINRVQELSYLRARAGGIEIGALARQAQVQRSPEVARVQPLLSEALAHVAHPAIRNRGTVVGSLVHADPSAELGAVLVLLGGSVRIATVNAEREVAAAEFFRGPLESAVEYGELAVSAYFPALAPLAGTAFCEVARRHGDFAICGVAALVQLDDDLRIESARAAYLSCAPTPQVLDLTEALHGRGFDASLDHVANIVTSAITPEPDIHASREYRRHLAGVLTVRALHDAVRAAAPSEAA